MYIESQFSMRKVFKYCSLLFLGLVLTAGSWCLQSASAQHPSGSLQLVGPSPDPSPGDDIEIEVQILNPQNVSVFTIEIEYPTVFDYDDFEPGTGQFDKNNLSLGREMHLTGGRTKRQFVLGINHNNMGKPVFVSEGTLFTVTFETVATIETGHYQVKIVGTPHIQGGGVQELTELDADNIPSLNVPIRGPMQGTVRLIPTAETERVGETGFIDIELEDRSRAHRYEITVDPSANLGPLTVSYNSDDTNGTAITNHTAGDPITISADLWLPNDPFIIDDATGQVNHNDWRVTHSDPIVATLFFTPTTAGEGSFEITEAKIFDSDDTALTLSNPDPLTFTIDSSETENIVHRNTGVGPKPIIEVAEGTKDGPFQAKITFLSKNYIEKQLLRAADGKVVATFLFQRGVYGFGRDEIEVGGTAGASATTRLWDADGAGVYYARINPTETGAREVTLQVPAGVVYEVGTNLPNVASEIVTVRTNLAYPPWDVDENGTIDAADTELVEAALGQGMEDIYGIELYVNTIENPRTDVNGDRYVNQVDVDLVRMHITDNDGGAQGDSDEVRGQAENTAQARNTEPDPSVWMPDENLRTAIRKKLNITDDAELTQARMTDFSSLTVNNKRINDITGLEYATNLKKLDLRKNRISDIAPLAGLTELTELKIGENNISDITALAGLTKLTHVGLAENQISDITALGNLTKLKEVWLRENNVSSITVLANLTQLTRLSLENNEVSGITALGNLTKLIYLNLKDNEVSNITALANLTKLTYLNLRDNEISDTTALGNLIKLKELWMADNNVSSITALGNLIQITRLSLENNEVSDITALGNLTKLTQLNLKSNEISDITVLGNLTKLTYLNFRYNGVSDITALANLTKLTELWAADNNISDVSPLSSLTKLKKLGLANNPILDTSPLYSLTQGALKNVDITISEYPPWDVNEDGSVDATDSALVTAALGQSGNNIVDDRTDVNGDGTVDQDDLTLITDNLDTDGGAPSTSDLLTLLDRETLEALGRETLEVYLNALRAESDGSPKYLRAIAMIESLLATTRPKQTRLLANYPNPFNPETWIPYQLANASDVQIIIYDTRGTVVRRLDLGHQPEGYYTTRSRAAYWDGRNTFGERVASGTYFYQFQADNISSLRKLLILK